MTLAKYRSLARTEESMIRAMMPRTSAADPAPLLPAFAPDGVPSRTRWSLGRRLETKGSFTLQEVAHV